jgi:hypothetical protein
MHFIYNILLVALLAVALAAGAAERQIIVSYPEDTPASVIEEAMEAIRKAVSSQILRSGCLRNANAMQGGFISHEYHLIKGFAAKVTDDAIDEIQSLGGEAHTPKIEDDKVVSVNDS